MVRAVVFDLLMAVMDSLSVWAAAAGDRQRGLAWRDGVAARLRRAPEYSEYESLVRAEAKAQGLDRGATARLIEAWQAMEPWPDTASVAGITLPYGFLTNCSTSLAQVAAGRSGLRALFTISAEEAGWYKPHPMPTWPPAGSRAGPRRRSCSWPVRHTTRKERLAPGCGQCSYVAAASCLRRRAA